MTQLILNDDQGRALGEIMAASKPGNHHLLTGFAGSGKTTLLQKVAGEFGAQGLKVVLTAPTHKAVQVLEQKLAGVNLENVQTMTVHRLLSLKPKPDGARIVYARSKSANALRADVVIVDECSMLDSAMMAHIHQHLPRASVLFVGDPAQLPPVNEEASLSFNTQSRSHLETIVRQGADNPILKAAHAIRASQGGPLDWSWMKSAHAKPCGVYMPKDADSWMRKAFTSDEYAYDPDRFRYLAWTNAKVDLINARIRSWRYAGADLDAPFVPGETALLRAPVVRDGIVIFSTNEESEVVSIEQSEFTAQFDAAGKLQAWAVQVPSWRVGLRHPDGTVKFVHSVRCEKTYAEVLRMLRIEAVLSTERAQQRQDFLSWVAQLRASYAMTVHSSQGSTFANAFVDVADIKRRSRNVLETQQLLYVAATRPSQALILVST